MAYSLDNKEQEAEDIIWQCISKLLSILKFLFYKNLNFCNQ